MKRLAFMLLLLVFVALGTPGAANEQQRVRIEHLDGSGTETIVDVQPSIPGVRDFIRTTPGPIPQPGDLMLPPSPTPTWSPPPTARPPAY